MTGTSGSAVFDNLLVATCPYTVKVVAISQPTAADPVLISRATDQLLRSTELRRSVLINKGPYYMGEFYYCNRNPLLIDPPKFDHSRSAMGWAYRRGPR